MANAARSLIRHVGLYFWYLRANWLSLMAYPATFISMNVAGVVYAFGSAATVWVLFSQIHAIGDWSYPQVLLIYGVSILSRSLCHLLWVGLMFVSGLVRDGSVDRILVRPLNPLFQVVAGYLDEDDWGEFATAVILIWTSLGMLGQRTWLNVGWLVVAGISGSVIFAGIRLVAAAMSFLTVQSRGFMDLSWTVDEFTRYPADIYGKGVRTVITWAIPVAFASFYPAQLIFGDGRLRAYALATPLVAIATFAICYRFWLYALDNYQGVGN
ncbi:MAG: ABC transporter permease [Bacillota bacterium]